MNKQLALIIHGGCGSFDLSVEVEKDNYEGRKRGLSQAIESAWRMLTEGSSALDVVEHAVNLMEEDPVFNAGIGGALDAQKRVSLDASIMRGDTLDAGAVARIRGIPRTISVARKVMEESYHTFLAGEGANDFAESQGFQTLADEEFITEYQLHWWNKSERPNPNTNRGTVGAVALDKNGLIVSGTSTGGMSKNSSGRIGDTPIIGAGTFADNRYGGASATGYGEPMLRIGLTRTAIDFIRFQRLSAMEASKRAIEEIAPLPLGIAGVVTIDKEGEIGHACNDECLPLAYMKSGLTEPVVSLERSTT
jgi:beta-aspartyl-peptidase (threonine type)